MGMQGAFDSTTFAASQESLERRRVDKTMMKWTVNMLRYRNIHLTNQGHSAEAKFVKGCLEGGVVIMMRAALFGRCSSVPIEVTSVLLHFTTAAYVTFCRGHTPRGWGTITFPMVYGG